MIRNELDYGTEKKGGKFSVRQRVCDHNQNTQNMINRILPGEPHCEREK